MQKTSYFTVKWLIPEIGNKTTFSHLITYIQHCKGILSQCAKTRKKNKWVRFERKNKSRYQQKTRASTINCCIIYHTRNLKQQAFISLMVSVLWEFWNKLAEWFVSWVCSEILAGTQSSEDLTGPGGSDSRVADWQIEGLLEGGLGFEQADVFQ